MDHNSKHELSTTESNTEDEIVWPLIMLVVAIIIAIWALDKYFEPKITSPIHYKRT